MKGELKKDGWEYSIQFQFINQELLKHINFLKKLLSLGNPIIYRDREVNDEDDDGAGEDENDDLTIKFIQQIPY